MITNPAFKRWLTEVCKAIDQTALSQAIQGAPWAVPTVQTVHILAIAALMAAALMANLRMAGLRSTHRATGEVLRTLKPVIWWALPMLLASGVLLIIGEPTRALKNTYFQLKMMLLIGAIVVTLVQFSGLGSNLSTTPSRWERQRGAAVVIALVSMSLWVGIIFAGRWIAYA